jgi:methyltransferase-like protein
MRIHGERFEDPLEQVEQGQTLVRFVAKALAGSESAYAKVIDEELKLFRYFDPKYFYHDFLSPENRPVLFRDFVARARSHGLQYLGDSTLGEMLTSSLPAEIASALSRLAGDVATMGQYLDLVRGTGFRRTLLCHEGIDLKRELSGEDLHGVRIAILGEITAETDLKSDAPVTWRSSDGTEVHVTGPIGKAAMLRLAASAPEEIEFDDLRDRARELLGAARDDADEIKALGGVVLHAHGVGLLDLSPRDRGLFGRITDRPVADPLIRLEAARKLSYTTNRRHETVALTPFDHEILPLLDGAHEHGAIRAAVRTAVVEGRLTVTVEGSQAREAGAIAEAVDENVARRLEQIRASAFLVG